MQMLHGAFSEWPGFSAYFWREAGVVSHFLWGFYTYTFAVHGFPTHATYGVR